MGRVRLGFIYVFGFLVVEGFGFLGGMGVSICVLGGGGKIRELLVFVECVVVGVVCRLVGVREGIWFLFLVDNFVFYVVFI